MSVLLEAPARPAPPAARPARWALVLPWLFLGVLAGLMGFDWYRNGGVGTAIDPVCGMEVRAGAGPYSFCSLACQEAFEKGVRRAGPGHVMRGIPTRMYQAGVAAVILVSFLLFGLFGRKGAGAMAARLDLTALPGVRALLSSGALVLVLRLGFSAAFLGVIAAGLFGDQNPALNIAPLLTWTVWWAGLIFVVLFAGKAWCTVCPWDALAGWTAAAAGRLDNPWPRWARNIWPAVALFLALTWLELGAGITLIPRATAWVALGMLGLSVASAMVFERKSFCRYGCLVGRVSGLYAMFASLEVRAKDSAVCSSCRTMDCFKGNAAGDGCPTFEFPRTMSLNTYCTLCTDCFKTCPHGNVALRLRPWGADLAGEGKPRTDEAALALVLLSMTGFHGLTMTPSWPRWVDGLEAWGLGYWPAFSVLMAMVLGLPVLAYAALVRASAALAPERPFRAKFVQYAYALLPIALFYHLAHNAEHFLMEGPKLLSLASDPMGRGWDLFGTASWRPVPLITLSGLWLVQLLLVVTGHVYSLWITDRTARRLAPAGSAAFWGQVPMVGAMVAFSVFSLWLLAQPMAMRTSGM